MQRSTDRILTTHAGSLPRPDEVASLVIDSVSGKQADQEALNDRVRQAVADVVARQHQVGIDIVSDGEMGKIGFSNYLAQRYPSFSQRAGLAETAMLDVIEVPELFATLFTDPAAFARVVAPVIDAPLTPADHEGIDREISDLLSTLDGVSPDQAFISSVTPGQQGRRPGRAPGSEHRRAQPGAGGPAPGADSLARVLGQLRRPSSPGCRTARDHPPDPAHPGGLHLHRGG